MTKTFEQINQTDPKSLMILDSLNLAFRYKHSKAVDFATDYMRTVESLQKSYKTKKLIIAGDMGSSSYRKAIYPEYKQNRNIIMYFCSQDMIHIKSTYSFMIVRQIHTMYRNVFCPCVALAA